MGELTAKLLNREITSSDQYWEELREEAEGMTPVEFAKEFINPKTPLQKINKKFGTDYKTVKTAIKELGDNIQTICPDESNHNPFDLTNIVEAISNPDESFIIIQNFSSTEKAVMQQTHGKKGSGRYFPAYDRHLNGLDNISILDTNTKPDCFLDELIQRTVNSMGKYHSKGIGWTPENSKMQVLPITSMIKGSIVSGGINPEMRIYINNISLGKFDVTISKVPSLTTPDKNYTFHFDNICIYDPSDIHTSNPNLYFGENIKVIGDIHPKAMQEENRNSKYVRNIRFIGDITPEDIQTEKKYNRHAHKNNSNENYDLWCHSHVMALLAAGAEFGNEGKRAVLPFLSFDLDDLYFFHAINENVAISTMGKGKPSDGAGTQINDCYRNLVLMNMNHYLVHKRYSGEAGQLHQDKAFFELKKNPKTTKTFKTKTMFSLLKWNKTQNKNNTTYSG